MKPAPKNAIKWLFFGCSHCPLHDPDAIAFIADQVRRWSPNVLIHGGDLFEMKSASRWPNEYSWSMLEEYAEADKVLKQVRTAHKKPDEVECVYLPGNHCANMLAVGRVQPDLRDMCMWDVPQYTRPNDGRDPVWINQEFITKWTIRAAYKYNRRDGVFRIGSTSFYHGYESGVSSDEMQAIHLGVHNGLGVSAHTHRPTDGAPRQALRTKTMPLPFYYLNSGCSLQMDMEYMERRRQILWGQGLVRGWTLPGDQNNAKWRKTWDAECLVHRMYDEY